MAHQAITRRALLLSGAAASSGIEGADADKGTLHGVPAVMPGFWGSHLGLIDLDLERTGAGWKVAGFKVEARPIYTTRTAPWFRPSRPRPPWPPR